MTKPKILIVDDSPTAIMWQRMILEGEPFEILVAGDGDEALQVARAAGPDLVLLDVVMPRMDGFATCRALRQDPRTRNVPILMVTTRGAMPSVLHGFECGCNEYITKPIDAAELVTKVRGYLPSLEAAP